MCRYATYIYASPLFRACSPILEQGVDQIAMPGPSLRRAASMNMFIHMPCTVFLVYLWRCSRLLHGHGGQQCVLAMQPSFIEPTAVSFESSRGRSKAAVSSASASDTDVLIGHEAVSSTASDAHYPVCHGLVRPIPFLCPLDALATHLPAAHS